MATTARDLLAQEISGRLRARREELGYSLELVAGLVEISKPALILYETGRQFPRSDTLRRLAFVLGVTIEDLYPDDFTPFVSEEARLIANRSNATPPGTTERPAHGQRAKTSKRSRREGGI